MRRSPHPPAWYPDPQDPDRIRRWNGRAWTEEIRPLPNWLRTLRLSPGPSTRRVPRNGRRLWLTSAALLALGAVITVYLGPPGGDDDRIGDRNFVRLASARCAETGTAVVEPNNKPREGSAEARRIDALATGWGRWCRISAHYRYARATPPQSTAGSEPGTGGQSSGASTPMPYAAATKKQPGASCAAAKPRTRP